MGVRYAFARAPQWVRASWWVVLGAAYALGLAALVGQAASRAGVLTALAMGVTGGSAVAALEPFWWRRESRQIGWHGDWRTLIVVRAEIISDVVPTDTAERRELARRYAVKARDRVKTSKFSALILLGCAVTMVILTVTLRDTGAWLLAVLWMFCGANPAYQVWVLLPRYRRVRELLGDDEAPAGWGSYSVPVISSATGHTPP